jgi:carboxylesterase type B
MLEGAHFGTARNEVMFLGIPYAAPPTGDRRWKAPQPVEKWPGVRKATSYGRLVLRQKTLRPKSSPRKWFSFPVHRFAVNTVRTGQKAWFYYFTYPARAKYYADHSTFHGIEMKFLSG